MADYIRPLPRPQRTPKHTIDRAIASGASSVSVVVGGGGGGGGTNALDAAAVGDGSDGNTTDVFQVNSTNDQIEAGTGS